MTDPKKVLRGFTRRGFLNGAAVGGTALMTGGMLSASLPAEAGRRSSSLEAHRLSQAFAARRRAAEHARGFGAGVGQVERRGGVAARPDRLLLEGTAARSRRRGRRQGL